MTAEDILDNVEKFSDTELAILLCLISKEHCIIEGDGSLLDHLAEEVGLVATTVFRLSYALVDCSEDMQLDDFADSILAATPNENLVQGTARSGRDSRSHFASIQFGRKSSNFGQEAGLDTRKVANVVIAKGFNLAPEAIQVQSLELIRRRRIYGRSTIHQAPEIFLFIPMMSSLRPPLNRHLNDHLMMHHYYDPGDGFPNLDACRNGLLPPRDIFASTNGDSSSALTSLRLLSGLCNDVSISPEVRKYCANITVFLRLQRGYFRGVSPKSTSHLLQLSRSLSVIHRLQYLTPSLVHLAAQKIYTHRIEIPSPERERSFQYGSDLNAIEKALAGITPEAVTDEALTMLEQPT